MRERQERVESPGAYVTERVSLGHFSCPCVLSDGSPVLWWLSHGEGGIPLHDKRGINCKNGVTSENQGAGVTNMGKWVYVGCLYVSYDLSDFT